MAAHNAQPSAMDRSAAPDAPRVAVVVPSYNHAPYLERCLRSIFAQTFPPAELVVIDDGSRDDSPAVAARVLADCPFPAELIVRPNRGLCATLNEGLARTRGELFAYLGSDDYWHPIPTVTYRRAALERERWDERCRLEDYDLYLRLARLGPFAFIERPLAYW